MGPTEILPQSQYLSNDHEVNPTHPLIGGGITGGISGAADPADSEGGRAYSAHVEELGWPNRVERLTIPAGTVVLTHCKRSSFLPRLSQPSQEAAAAVDVFHRGTHGPVEGQPHRLMLSKCSRSLCVFFRSSKQRLHRLSGRILRATQGQARAHAERLARLWRV